MLEAQDSPAGLKRTLSLWQVTASGVGVVIGAGIYVVIGAAAGKAGNALWLSFALSALLAVLTGASYAELAGLFPTAGAEYGFVKAAFGRFAGFMAGWVMIGANVIAGAAVAIGFAHYLRHFVDVSLTLGAAGLLCGLLLLIMAGLQRAIWVSATLVVLQIGGILLVIVAGAPHIGQVDLLESATVGGVLSGAALVFFAFIGFDEIVTLSEETKDPRRTIPRALLLALGISTILYVLVAIAAVSVVPWPVLAASERPLAEVIAHDWGSRAADIVAFVALASTTNTSLLVLTAASRLIYSLGREGYFPRAFTRVGRGTAAPYIGAAVAVAIAMALAFVKEIKLLAAATDFAVYVIFALVNGSLIALRLRGSESAWFRVPLAVGRVPVLPVAGIATTVLMAVSLESGAWLGGAAIVGTGVGFWFMRRLAVPAALPGP